MNIRRVFSPTALPVYAFAGAILIGAVLLTLEQSVSGQRVGFVDALFTATSAVCVTGLTVVDTGSTYSSFGQAVILLLIQLGGLGIMTYASLFFYLWRRRVSLSDREAVGRALMHNPAFNLGKFLRRLVVLVLVLEGLAAVGLYAAAGGVFDIFAAVFHSVSAFCNAGFGLLPDNLASFRNNIGVNMLVMGLIILGGLGFSVLDELIGWVRARAAYLLKFSKKVRVRRQPWPLSRHCRIVLSTTAVLIFGGAVLIWLAEYLSGNTGAMIWPSLFQSVTCRTAGFNTIGLGTLSNVTLMIMANLMFIGGSTGSCAGGLKVTTFRVLCGFFFAQILGRRQVVLHGRAVARETLQRALVLFFLMTLIIVTATMILALTEGGLVRHGAGSADILELFFEVVSAFCTVGLTVDVTPTLSVAGKSVIIALMFIGRIGPIWLLSALHHMQREQHFNWPEEESPIG